MSEFKLSDNWPPVKAGDILQVDPCGNLVLLTKHEVDIWKSRCLLYHAVVDQLIEAYDHGNRWQNVHKVIVKLKELRATD